MHCITIGIGKYRRVGESGVRRAQRIGKLLTRGGGKKADDGVDGIDGIDGRLTRLSMNIDIDVHQWSSSSQNVNDRQ